ncbi:MAG: hydroxymethylbilane synthase [Chloroflexota bacterium]|jgi:hydroxymethylbilane synthase|nr:hydroxymethylbilane synthase [Chloroflexota bacterium]
MTTTVTLRIGTRGSRLALAQARIAVEALAPTTGSAEVVSISTSGDAISARQPHVGWVKADGQFTRELERALLEGRVDLVVHSYKDLPTAPVEGLAIGAVLERADARDCLLTADGGTLDDLRFGARVGTSSPRRAAQLAAARSDLIATPIRGNVETRLRRMQAGELDALILAAAGLDRLGIELPDHARLPFDLMLPAPAQGALAIQVRSEDGDLRAALATADHVPTRVAVDAERALLRRIGGGCLAPLGALGEVAGGTLRLRAAYEDRSGAYWRADASGPAHDADAVVTDVAERILAT